MLIPNTCIFVDYDQLLRTVMILRATHLAVCFWRKLHQWPHMPLCGSLVPGVPTA